MRVWGDEEHDTSSEEKTTFTKYHGLDVVHMAGRLVVRIVLIVVVKATDGRERVIIVILGIVFADSVFMGVARHIV